MRYKYLINIGRNSILPALSLLFFPGFIFAQVNGYFHCQDGSNPQLSLRESDSRVLFEVDFHGPISEKRFFVVAEDSHRAKEHLLAKLSCDQNTGVCSGETTARSFDKLEKKISPAPWSVSLRASQKKAFCIGELHDDSTYFAEFGLVEKLYCNFNPLSDSGIRLEGTFEPRKRLEPSFFLVGEGFNQTGKLSGCVERNGKWSKIFELDVHESGTPTSSLFDIADLDADETSLISDIPWLYQSEWIHGHQFVESGSLGNRLGLTSVFGQFTKTPKTGSNFINDTAKSRTQSAAKRRKREKSAKNKRVLETLRGSKQQSKRNFSRRPDRFLEFDPAIDTLYLTYASCSSTGTALPDGLGTLTCGERGQAGSKEETCTELNSSSNKGMATATACQEVFYFVDALIVTVQDLNAGSYFLCIDGSAVSDTIEVSEGTLGLFGELRLVDDLKTSVDTTSVYKYYGLKDLTEISSVEISASSDCSTPLFSGTL